MYELVDLRLSALGETNHLMSIAMEYYDVKVYF